MASLSIRVKFTKNTENRCKRLPYALFVKQMGHDRIAVCDENGLGIMCLGLVLSHISVSKRIKCFLRSILSWNPHSYDITICLSSTRE